MPLAKPLLGLDFTRKSRDSRNSGHDGVRGDVRIASPLKIFQEVFPLRAKEDSRKWSAEQPSQEEIVTAGRRTLDPATFLPASNRNSQKVTTQQPARAMPFGNPYLA
jgi:hypothetical protein